MAGQISVPVAFQTIKLETVLRILMVDQMIGNATGGGCQEGRFLSRKTGSFFDTVGRELSSGEKTLLRKDNVKKSDTTSADFGCNQGIPRAMPTGSRGSRIFSTEARNPAIKDHCKDVASTYDPAALKSGVYVLTVPDAVVANRPGNDRLSDQTVLVLPLRVVDMSCCTLDRGGREKASDKRRK